MPVCPLCRIQQYLQLCFFFFTAENLELAFDSVRVTTLISDQFKTFFPVLYTVVMDSIISLIIS